MNRLFKIRSRRRERRVAFVKKFRKVKRVEPVADYVLSAVNVEEVQSWDVPRERYRSWKLGRRRKFRNLKKTRETLISASS